MIQHQDHDTSHEVVNNEGRLSLRSIGPRLSIGPSDTLRRLPDVYPSFARHNLEKNEEGADRNESQMNVVDGEGWSQMRGTGNCRSVDVSVNPVRYVVTPTVIATAYGIMYRKFVCLARAGLPSDASRKALANPILLSNEPGNLVIDRMIANKVTLHGATFVVFVISSPCGSGCRFDRS